MFIFEGIGLWTAMDLKMSSSFRDFYGPRPLPDGTSQVFSREWLTPKRDQLQTVAPASGNLAFSWNWDLPSNIKTPVRHFLRLITRLCGRIYSRFSLSWWIRGKRARGIRASEWNNKRFARVFSVRVWLFIILTLSQYLDT